MYYNSDVFYNRDLNTDCGFDGDDSWGGSGGNSEWEDDSWVSAWMVQMGDCWDHDEFGNGEFADGYSCMMDCANQGSFMANLNNQYGNCYCEYAEMYEEC